MELRTKIPLKGADLLKLTGETDTILKLLRDRYGVKIIIRGDELTLIGSDESKLNEVRSYLEFLIHQIRKGKTIREEDVLVPAADEKKVIPTPRGIVRPQSPGQEKYIEALNTYDVVVAIGPAGTGKTFLAVCKAVCELMHDNVKRIILTRPAVEAGESLGYLPGDFREKIDPYLRPLYDALYEIFPTHRVRALMDERKIEILPLAYMRGRNLNNAYILVDEAQNTTRMQMKMVLTRMGPNSRIAITGDITQIDLANKKDSGLLEIEKVLRSVSGIKFVYLTEDDCVRHPLVKQIIVAYENYEKTRKTSK